MAANSAYENEAAPEGHYEGIPASHFSGRPRDRKAADGEAPHDYDKLQRRAKCEPCGIISRWALILGFLVAIVVTNVAVGMAVWYIPQIKGTGNPAKEPDCPVSSESNGTNTSCADKGNGDDPDVPACMPCPMTTSNPSTNRTKGVCDADWEYYSETDYYYRGFIDSLDFYRAERFCVSHGSHLASCRSPDELFILKGITHMQEGSKLTYYLGGNDIVEEGVWLWIEGGPIGPWQPWHPYEPNSGDCLSINSFHFNEWVDETCSDNFRFICSKRAADA